MSRIGKKPITIPSGVEVKFNNGVVTVKGPKGELSEEIKNDITVEVADGQVEVKRPSEAKEHRAMHGLYRALINNMVVGVTEGYKKSLELVGVGFKATNQGNLLNLDLGYSHSIILQVPKEVSVSTETPKGAAPIVHLESTDKQLVGQVAAKLKSLRKPEPYKGKGVKFVGEQIRRKAGKTGK
ncbi:50S ribosomal protein L6 [Limibacter armeniacum]|uniref:50S ribosomal protein L6 n=1 Tax=Limibacter armeniacum TaxID=466084 RepID=UPI002FE672FB